MKKAVLVLVLIVIAGLFIWQYKQEETKTSALLQYVPADTAFYMGGTLDKSLAVFLADSPVFGFSPTETRLLDDIQSELSVSNTPAARFLTALFSDYSQKTDGSYQAFVDYFGLAFEGDYATYLHGLVPVINVPIVDQAKLVTLFKNLSEEAGISFQEKTLGKQSVLSWVVDKKNLQLVLATTESSAVLTLITDKDTETDTAERLAQTPVPESFEENLANIREQQQYTNDLVFMLDIEKLMNGLFVADNSRASNDFKRYFSDTPLAQKMMNDPDMQICQADTLKLISQVPRLLMGYNDIEVKDNQLMARVSALLEVHHPLVLNVLQSMQGHIPDHVVDAEDKISSMAVALDMDQLTPGVTKLWTEFANAEFSCPDLQQAQVKSKQMSPMVLGAVTGMAQGIKGLGLSLFDLHIDADAAKPLSIDFLLSLETSNPTGILSLLQLVPELANIRIPADGTEVPLNLPLPIDIPTFAAIKGSHVVVYSGEKSQQTISAIESEELTPNALGFSSSINYIKLVDLMENTDFSAIPGTNMESCMEVYSALDTLRRMEMQLSYRSMVNDKGVGIDSLITLNKPEATNDNFDITGQWHTAYLDEMCQWVEDGAEQWNEDGTGSYKETSQKASCDLYQTQYQWQRKGRTLTLTDTSAPKYRDSCQDEWQKDGQKETLVCDMINIKEDSFQCLYYIDGSEPFIYQYTR